MSKVNGSIAILGSGETSPNLVSAHKQVVNNIKDEVNCSQLIGWFEDLRIVNLSKCFITLQNRQKLAWRNKMVKKKLGIR